jgi:hypothetical protein
MSKEQVLRRLGRDELRVVSFDCSHSWVVPAGEAPGWYLVPLSRDGPDAPAADFIDESEIVFHERGLGDIPSYTLYRVDEPFASEHLALTHEAWSSPALAPAEAGTLNALSMPVNLDETIEYLGYQVSGEEVRPGDTVEITTVWHVLSRPEDFALSLFAHLVHSGGSISVGDALGYPAIQWMPGDLFVQRSELVVPADASPGRCWIQAGIYSLATGERLQVLEDGQSIADRILLTPIEVR